MREFIRRMTRRPVLDENGQLNEEILKAIKLLRIAGKDPLDEFRDCKYYLEDALRDMARNRRHYCRWQYRNGNPFKIGTQANIEYMLDGVQKIIDILVDEKINGPRT